MHKATHILLGLFLVCVAFGQNGDIPDPEFSMRPYIRDNGGKLKDLDRTDVMQEIRVKNFAGASDKEGTNTTCLAPGLTSTVRFKKGNIPPMFIKVKKDLEATDVICVVKAEIKKDIRRFHATSATAGGVLYNEQKDTIKPMFRKLAPGVFQVDFPANFGPGEYAFVSIIVDADATNYSSKTKISCFGVD